MTKLITIIVAAGLLASCASEKAVRVTNETAVAAVQSRARSEPIYYNGRTYQFEMKPDPAGGFSLSVGGMKANQEQDAYAVTTSSLRYYACPDGQTGVLDGPQKYVGGLWVAHGHCG
jgi:hypothetical protein